MRLPASLQHTAMLLHRPNCLMHACVSPMHPQGEGASSWASKKLVVAEGLIEALQVGC